MNAFDIHELKWWGWLLLWLTITLMIAVFRPSSRRELKDEEAAALGAKTALLGTALTLLLYVLMVPAS